MRQSPLNLKGDIAFDFRCDRLAHGMDGPLREQESESDAADLSQSNCLERDEIE